MLCVTRNRFDAGLTGRLVYRARLLTTSRRKSSPAFSPVPTAVAPMFSSSSCSDACATSSRAAPHAVRVAAELLPERDRHRILQMRAAGLEHVGELVRFPSEAFAKRVRVRHERRRAEQQRQPRRRREDVVRRLAHVDVIVRVHARVGALRLAEDLAGAVGEHLVGVHVVRRAGARLIHVDDELVAELARSGFHRPRRGWRRRLRVEPAERGVRFRGRLLHEDGGGDEVGGRAQAADREVLDRARGLDAVVGVGGNLELAERIAFGPEALQPSADQPQPLSILGRYAAFILRQRPPTDRPNLDRSAAGRARRDEDRAASPSPPGRGRRRR